MKNAPTKTYAANQIVLEFMGLVLKSGFAGDEFEAITQPPAEAPCTTCGRNNDVGVKVCWCCGGSPTQ